MTKSERLLSAFSENYFFKELILDDLSFTPEGDSVREVADLLINLGDIIIAIQLKERNEEDKTDNILSENKWLQKKCKAAKKQIKDTVQFISSGTLPAFKNKRGCSIFLQSDAKIVPLIVFDNSQISDYPHLLRKHSDSGMEINCMSFRDYQEMCRTLITPIEIVDYLEYRQELFEKHGEIDIMILDGWDNELVLTEPRKHESLVHQFLSEVYGIKNFSKKRQSVQLFRHFLQQLPDHTVESSSSEGAYEIIKFFAHLHCYEIYVVWERIELTKAEARKGVSGITRSLRNDVGEYAILFVANEFIRMKDLLPIIRRKANPKRVLEIIIYWQDRDIFRIDFLFWDDTKN